METGKTASSFRVDEAAAERYTEEHQSNRKAKSMEKGLIHIYCGDGKGKTTAAIGLAVRAAGAGKKVLIARFLKNDRSAELVSLKKIPGITVLPIEKEFGFIRKEDNPVRQEAARYYGTYFETAVRMAQQEGFDLLVLDEINAAVKLRIVEKDRLTEFLEKKPKSLEVVLTGRDPAPEICSMADYISEIKKIRHPFDEGIYARPGIEY